MEIGDRIKFLRENIGLNLTELAKRASIAKSTLHKIEENKTNPTINTIWAIAKALGVSFGELIDESGEIKEKGVSVNLIERGSSFESYKMKLSKGSYYVASPHFNGIKEQIVVLEGVVLVGDLKDPKLLASKNSFEFIANVPHIYKAIEEALLVVTLFFEKKEFFFYEDRFIDVLDKEIAQNFMEELIDGIEIIRVFPKEIRSFNIDGLNISETKEGVFLTLKRDKIFFKEGVEFRKDAFVGDEVVINDDFIEEFDTKFKREKNAILHYALLEGYYYIAYLALHNEVEMAKNILKAKNIKEILLNLNKKTYLNNAIALAKSWGYECIEKKRYIKTYKNGGRYLLKFRKIL